MYETRSSTTFDYWYFIYFLKKNLNNAMQINMLSNTKNDFKVGVSLGLKTVKSY